MGNASNPSLSPGGNSTEINGSRPIYISGKVVMQDGSPVPQDVTIQRLCSGVSKTVAYTDPRGHFSFQWGERNLVLADASDAGGDPSRNPTTSPGFGGAQSAGGSNAFAADPYGNKMMNCQLRANVAGFTSDAVNLFNRRSTDTPDIGTIVLHRIAEVEGSSVSVTSMMAPKDARKAYERGLQSLLKNKPDDAVKDFERAVAAYPKYAEAWQNLGKLHAQRKSMAAARASFLKAIDADPKLVPPYVELGMMAAADANWPEAGEYLDKALKLDPVDYPVAWYTDAVAHYNLMNYDAAEKSAREAVRLDQRHTNPRAGYLLGLILAEEKDYTGAAAQLTEYVKLVPNAPDLAQVEDRLKQLEKLAGLKQ